MTKTIIISLGGSTIALNKGIDTQFIKQFKEVIQSIDRNFIITIGGGTVCRMYQKAIRDMDGKPVDEDWIGIHTTRLNAHLLRLSFGIEGEIITDPTGPFPTGKIIFGAGYVPGHSTDYDAALLAKRTGATRLLNISNVTHVYTADPKEDPNAKKLPTMTWSELRELVGEWKPGLNAPFDPVAAKYCEENCIEAAILGKNLKNIKKAILGEEFDGTLVR